MFIPQNYIVNYYLNIVYYFISFYYVKWLQIRWFTKMPKFIENERWCGIRNAIRLHFKFRRQIPIVVQATCIHSINFNCCRWKVFYQTKSTRFQTLKVEHCFFFFLFFLWFCVEFESMTKIEYFFYLANRQQRKLEI